MTDSIVEGGTLTRPGPTAQRPTFGSADRTLLSVEDLRVSLRTNAGDVEIIHGVSFELGRGEILGLAGESGSGKSITALALLRLLPSGAEVSGSIRVDGVDVASLNGPELRRFRGTQARIIFQDPWSSLNPMLTIGRQLRSSLTAVKKMSKAEADARALEVLDVVHIPEARKRLDQYPHQLSGGMLQRVMIAYAIIAEPQLLICDEPTTALDVTTEAQILDLLSELNTELGTSLILTSHDLGVLSDSCDRLMVMYAGRIVEDGGVGELLANPLHPYTLALASAMPGTAQPRTHLRAVDGRPPTPGAPGVGCSFAPRCLAARASCTTATPALEVVPGFESNRRAACFVTAGGGELGR